jgi:peptide-methionine (S)-S-oxide reductase
MTILFILLLIAPVMEKNKIESAVLGGGCFWCTEAVFSELKGVTDVIPGYAGGEMKNPGYNDVVTGETGHAEVVKITYNPEVIPYEKLLEVFFLTHDPTTLNRQGADVGTQYRSVIFYTNEKQKETAQKVINEIEKNKIYSKPIVTEISELVKFYIAENYHHNYFANNK